MKKFEKIVNRGGVLNSNNLPKNKVTIWKKLSSAVKKIHRKLKYLDKTKATYFGISIFLIVFCLFTGGTYSYFMFSEHLNAAIISIAKLNYLLTSTNSSFINNSITVAPKQKLQFTLNLKSLNNQNTKYALDYIASSPDVKVYYKARKEQNVEGEIDGLNSVIDINLVIENTGDTEQTVNFDLKGGYLQNELESNIVDQWVSTIMAVSSSTNEKLWAHKEKVQRIVFEDALIPKENAEYTYDISSDQDGSVMSYLVPSSDDNTKYIAYIQSTNKVKANKNSSYLFRDFTNLESIENLSLLDTNNVTDMFRMFYYCGSLVELDLSGFDTSKVTNMGGMFLGCNSLMSLNLSNFNTSKVTNMNNMFRGCANLKTLNMSSFDTKNVTDMSSMFNMYISGDTTIGQLTNVILSNNFITSNVVDMSYMFQNCSNLESVDLSSFDTGKVINMCNMFKGCTNLKTLDLSSFDTRNVTDMSYMFYMYGIPNMTSKLTSLILSKNFNTSNVVNMQSMFDSCILLTSLDVSNFDTKNVTNMRGMFSGCNSLISLDLNNFDTSKVTDMGYMFNTCYVLKTVGNLSNFDTSNVVDMTCMFQGAKKLTTTITIRGTKCTTYDSIFWVAATESGASITVNYTSNASSLVSNMISTKNSTSNVRKGSQVA